VGGGGQALPLTRPISDGLQPPAPGRPNAADFLGPTATGFVPLQPTDGGASDVRARFRDVFPALNAEIPVNRTAGGTFGGMIAGPFMVPNPAYNPQMPVPGVPECLPDAAGTILRAEENWRALHRSMHLVRDSGGGKVLVPDVRDGDGERVPFYWLGDIRIPEGVELVIEGLLKRRQLTSPHPLPRAAAPGILASPRPSARCPSSATCTATPSTRCSTAPRGSTS